MKTQDLSPASPPTIPIPQKLTDRQSKYLEARIAGLSPYAARNKAGYAPGSPPNVLERSPALKNALINALAKAGIGEDYLARKIKEGLSSNDYRFFSLDGRVTDKRIIPDMAVREKYLRTALEVAGYIRKDADVNLNLGVIVAPTVRADDQWGDNQSPTTDGK